MNIFNFGSINVDYVFRTPHIVAPGETLPASSISVNPGGKGANQSAAIAKAGALVFHAGRVGKDTQWMIERLNGFNVNTSFIKVDPEVNGGQAIIQVDDNGQNSIIIFGGANQAMPESDIHDVLSAARQGDWLVLQNEINLTSRLIEAGHTAGLKICFNPAPMTDDVKRMPLEFVSLLILNEIEGAALAELPVNTTPETILDTLAVRYPDSAICLTIGSKGALYHDHDNGTIVQQAYKVKAVDTTAAGDTFTGFLLASLADGKDIRTALDIASKASAIAVSKPGAMDSIPSISDVARFA